jgi:lysophospholipase L1-like esterase
MVGGSGGEEADPSAGGGGMSSESGGGATSEGGASMGGSDPGGVDSCEMGTTSGNEVVFIGESFIAASSIPEEPTSLAIANGALQRGDAYLDFSVSGTRLGDGAIPRQYQMAAASNSIRFVLMNGGGNDCLQANDPNSPIPAAEALYEQMAADGVEKVVYFFYPDAAGSFGGANSSLQTCLNEYRPKIKAVCDGLTAPKCYWLDLAETDWSGNESAYTSDGIHPNAQGSQVTAAAIWDVMAANCVAP